MKNDGDVLIKREIQICSLLYKNVIVQNQAMCCCTFLWNKTGFLTFFIEHVNKFFNTVSDLKNWL